MSEKPSQSTSAEDYDGFVCKPLKSLKEVAEFLKDPPAWRSLCVELKPHSEYAVSNMDIVRLNHPEENYDINVERPETFCHFDPDQKEVARHKRKDLPKTLVCHDMANGYHDDSKVDGTSNYDAYTFYNWAAVDIFCYFSHHFVTIPPLGWINVGHAHGVKVIGTVITEWADGCAIWDKLLAEPAEWQGFAAALVSIAKTLKFDGWLLNIENKISKPTVLLSFVRHLHALLHRELAAPELIWYDSVTEQGQLHWQNSLNQHNKAFFDACDGIFTNYAWSEADVLESAAAAGPRRSAVYVGVDVWGRNFIGGGQLNTQHAVRIVQRARCSLAVFAPAWSHEAAPAPSARGLRERALWGSLWPCLSVKLPSTLPFRTSFCRGQGPKRRLYGEVVSPGPWYNLRHQQYQPNAAHGAHTYRLSLDPRDPRDPRDPGDPAPGIRGSIRELFRKKVKKKAPEPAPRPSYPRYTALPTEGIDCLEVYYKDSFNGGSCLAVDGTHGLVRLLLCDFPLAEGLVVCVASKPLAGRAARALDVLLTVLDERGGEARLRLEGGGGGGERPGEASLRPLRSAADPAFRELQRYLLLHQPGFYVSVENAYGWDVRYYSVSAARARLVGVACAGAALLGLLGLCHRREVKE